MAGRSAGRGAAFPVWRWVPWWLGSLVVQEFETETTTAATTTAGECRRSGCAVAGGSTPMNCVFQPLRKMTAKGIVEEAALEPAGRWGGEEGQDPRHGSGAAGAVEVVWAEVSDRGVLEHRGRGCHGQSVEPSSALPGARRGRCLCKGIACIQLDQGRSRRLQLVHQAAKADRSCSRKLGSRSAQLDHRLHNYIILLHPPSPSWLQFSGEPAAKPGFDVAARTAPVRATRQSLLDMAPGLPHGSVVRLEVYG
ncbi:hypothetical protein Micbo1qcDRAFT_195650 [Microdochium bolleyi]|uniref:Uncharacterized protein n=1 Tax=Microdochium bolleyi TaxID=196109 RepID=A0A136J3Q9_9PEZI|nr:hypothetical protein Micbo1qcDRAFT_195650 [Microdochium bolleyi]